MKRIIVIIGCLLAAISGAAQSKVITDSLQSQVLQCHQKYNVYLPDGYDPALVYPVVYLLHGLYGCYSDWVERADIKAVADLLTASGEICEMVIIMPNAGDSDVHHYQNGYFNVQGWSYEDFFFQEFMPEVERKYNCGGKKELRSIMGLSMGGGGSVVYCQRHPELFSSCYAMSPWLDNKHRDARGTDIPGSKLTITDNSVHKYSALDFMDRADDATVDRLKTVKWFLDCGDDDSLMPQSVNLHLIMRAAGIPCELRVRDGAHTWEYWHTALYTALPFASRSFR